MRRDLQNRVENLERQHGTYDDIEAMSAADLWDGIVGWIDELGGPEGLREALANPPPNFLEAFRPDGIRSLIEDCDRLIEIRGEPEFVEHWREWEALEKQEPGSSQKLRAEYLSRRRQELSMAKKNETRYAGR